MEITRIWKRLFVGSMRGAEGLREDNPHCISTVITLCDQPVRFHHPAIQYLHCPIEDSQALRAIELNRILRLIAKSIRRETVLLHCMAGASRSPIIAAAWMQATGYKDLNDAIEEIASQRPGLELSPELLLSVARHL